VTGGVTGSWFAPCSPPAPDFDLGCPSWGNPNAYLFFSVTWMLAEGKDWALGQGQTWLTRRFWASELLRGLQMLARGTG
jgi:hypothetical protein